MKQKTVQPFIRERVDIPRVSKDKSGATILLCPFCNPTHPLRADGMTQCGTILRVQAVQTLYKAKYAKNPMTCVKCGKSDGEMVSWQGTAYVHAENCSPNTITLPEPPAYSKLAELVYSINFAKTISERLGWTAMKVDEVDQNGQRTGVILGYAFMPKKK